MTNTLDVTVTCGAFNNRATKHSRAPISNDPTFDTLVCEICQTNYSKLIRAELVDQTLGSKRCKKHINSSNEVRPEPASYDLDQEICVQT